MRVIRGGRLSDEDREALRREVIRAAWGERGYDLLASLREEVYSLPVFRALSEHAESPDDYFSLQVLLEGVAARALIDPATLDRLAEIPLPGEANVH